MAAQWGGEKDCVLIGGPLRYASELTKAMDMLATDDRVIFLGQAIKFKGTVMSDTLFNVSMDRKIEFPVAEEFQMGASIGLALIGFIPVSIFTRWNFLLLAANQLVNHLDKMKANVIIRVGVGSSKPLDPGPQHVGDFSKAFELMCPNIRFVTLETTDMILPAYREALRHEGPTVLTEIADLYE